MRMGCLGAEWTGRYDGRWLAGRRRVGRWESDSGRSIILGHGGLLSGILLLLLLLLRVIVLLRRLVLSLV